VKPEEIEALIDAMTEHSESTLESFFYSYGLGDAFNSPGRGWGKRKEDQRGPKQSRVTRNIAR
jgi:hypothetical protein